MRPASEVAAKLGRCWLAADHAATSLGYVAAISEPAAIIEQDRAALVAEIVAWLRADDFTMTADAIQAKWGKV